jgi:tripartite-type tricarboxylate transporter receptor subunit TctC
MKRWLALIAGLAAVIPVFAQPSKPVRLIVGVPPGGTSDTSARIIAPKLAELLGQQVVVENRPGANNGIATEYVARSAPDGQTVLWAFSGGIVVNPVFYPDVRYDPLKDLIPVDLIGTFQFILVVPRAVPANSIKELLVLAKASGANEYTYASGGIGSPNHLAGEMLKRAAGVNLRHVPYKGGGPAVVSVLAGETKMYFAGIGSVREHMKSGALKALAVTGPRRASEAPSVPTMQEAGIAGYDVQAWIGALVPAGTSEELVARLHGGLSKVVAMPEIDVRLRREGLEPAGISPHEFGVRIKRELAMWDKLIKEAGIKPE